MSRSTHLALTSFRTSSLSTMDSEFSLYGECGFCDLEEKVLAFTRCKRCNTLRKEHVFGHPKMTWANHFIGCVDLRRIGHFPARIPASKVRGGEIQIQIRKFLRRKRIAPLRIDGNLLVKRQDGSLNKTPWTDMRNKEERRERRGTKPHPTWGGVGYGGP